MLSHENPIPEQRKVVVEAMNPVKVKKELSDYATLISCFGQKSSFVHEHNPSASWKRTMPIDLGEELRKLCGWERCEDQKCFLVSMPNDHDPLALPDKVPLLVQRVHVSVMFAGVNGEFRLGAGGGYVLCTCD